jgi:hypothetical protein
MCDRDIPARHNIQVAGFQADWALVFIKPSQEITPDRSRSDEVERRYNVEINTVGRIE